MVRRPATGKDFKPSWRLSGPTGPRSVSAFRVAFLVAEVTERQLQSKRATPRCTPCAPQCPDCCRRTCPEGGRAVAANPSAHVTAPHGGPGESAADRQSLDILSSDPGATIDGAVPTSPRRQRQEPGGSRARGTHEAPQLNPCPASGAGETWGRSCGRAPTCRASPYAPPAQTACNGHCRQQSRVPPAPAIPPRPCHCG